MNKFKRVLSDAHCMDILAKIDGFSATSEGEVYVGSGDDVWFQLAEFAERVEQAAIAKYKEKLVEQEPICYLLGDPKDRPRVLSTEFMSRPNTFSVDAVITPVFERPTPRAPETESFVLRCDYCKKETDDPWHGSGFIGSVESKHIHACDDCVHLLPTPRLMY